MGYFLHEVVVVTLFLNGFERQVASNLLIFLAVKSQLLPSLEL